MCSDNANRLTLVPLLLRPLYIAAAISDLRKEHRTSDNLAFDLWKNNLFIAGTLCFNSTLLRLSFVLFEIPFYFRLNHPAVRLVHIRLDLIHFDITITVLFLTSYAKHTCLLFSTFFFLFLPLSEFVSSVSLNFTKTCHAVGSTR